MSHITARLEHRFEGLAILPVRMGVKKYVAPTAEQKPNPYYPQRAAVLLPSDRSESSAPAWPRVPVILGGRSAPNRRGDMQGGTHANSSHGNDGRTVRGGGGGRFSPGADHEDEVGERHGNHPGDRCDG